jgi:glucose/arabinose dehydrogenase
MASLEITFYPASGSFAKSYDGDAFASGHHLWNREKRAGYEASAYPCTTAETTAARKTS